MERCWPSRIGEESPLLPHYAIVKLQPNHDVLKLFQLLITNGYSQVSFVQGDPLAQLAAHKTSERASDQCSPLGSDTSASEAENSRRSSEDSERLFRLPPPSTDRCSLPLLSRSTDGDRGATPPYALFSPSGGPHLPPPPPVFSTPTLSALLQPPPPPPIPTLRPASPPPQPLCSERKLRTPLRQQRPRSDIPYTSPATTQLRQRGSRAQSDDPSVFVACRLCQNKIMASRLSNLTNHVRRHSTLKQFQCCYCDYTHNEMAKVRLHMLHNHKDKDSQPIDNLSPEMQASWDILMQQCFPLQYQARPANLGATPPTTAPSTTTTSTICIPTPISLPEADKEGSCNECGLRVPKNGRVEHVHSAHLNCAPFLCSVCGTEASEQAHLALHIALKHGGEAQVLTRDTVTIAEALVPAFFGKERGSGLVKTSESVSISPTGLSLPTVEAIPANNPESEAETHSLPTSLEAKLCSEKQLECSVCGLRAESESALKVHLWKHKLIGNGIKASLAMALT